MTEKWIVWLVCGVAFFVSLGSLLFRAKPQLFGSEAIRRRLRLPHFLVMFAALVSLGVLINWTKPVPHPPPPESDFLALATILVLSMLFGFVAFEAGTVASAYRNQSAEKNLLVIMFSLAAYIGGRVAYDHFSGAAPFGPMGIVFQAGFACTVALIVSNALTERTTTSTNLLCAIFSAGLAYPTVAWMVWADAGWLHQIGFVDASGASAVHLLGASISLPAAAAVGDRVRLQRWRFLKEPATPDFSSPFTVVGGLFLMFGWLGFNSGNAALDLHGHAFLNTMVGACSGAVAAWMLSKVGQVLRWKQEHISRNSAPHKTSAVIEGLEVGPRFVIGMMGGLVAVTANGALAWVTWEMAVAESFVGGLVAVLISTGMAARSAPSQIDDPLGVIGTHGCAAVVGLVATAIWSATSVKSFLPQLAVQLIGCGVCVVVGWLVAMAPCLLLLTTERRAIVNRDGSWLAAKFRLRLGAIEQLGTTRETPEDVEWNDRIDEATNRILTQTQGDPDKWWEAVRTYATAEVLDKSAQAAIAQQIVDKLADTADSPQNERIALVALSSATQYARPEDISRALELCLMRARGNGNGDRQDNEEVWGRRELLMWSTALLTERTAVLGAARPDLLPRAYDGFDFLRTIAISDKNVWVQERAAVGTINANARLFSDFGVAAQPSSFEPFDAEGRWKTIYALVTHKTALATLFFLADRRSATIQDTAETFAKTREATLEIATVLAAHGLISRRDEKLTIEVAGLELVERFQRAVRRHSSSRAVDVR